MKLQNMKRGETTEQIALFNWAMRSTHVLPCLSLMYHVPNEGKRTNGPVLKAMGMKNGVPDVCLPVASHNFHGLYLEMKYGNNKPTKAQEEYMAALQQQGYKTVVCYGAEEAKTEIMDYLQDPERMPLDKCINAPWIDGMCDGVPMPGRMFAKEPCRGCEKHRKTRAESVIEANMEAVTGRNKYVDLLSGRGNQLPFCFRVLQNFLFGSVMIWKYTFMTGICGV